MYASISAVVAADRYKLPYVRSNLALIFRGTAQQILKVVFNEAVGQKKIRKNIAAIQGRTWPPREQTPER